MALRRVWSEPVPALTDRSLDRLARELDLTTHGFARADETTLGHRFFQDDSNGVAVAALQRNEIGALAINFFADESGESDGGSTFRSLVRDVLGSTDMREDSLRDEALLNYLSSSAETLGSLRAGNSHRRWGEPSQGWSYPTANSLRDIGQWVDLDGRYGVFRYAGWVSAPQRTANLLVGQPTLASFADDVRGTVKLLAEAPLAPSPSEIGARVAVDLFRDERGYGQPSQRESSIFTGDTQAFFRAFAADVHGSSQFHFSSSFSSEQRLQSIETIPGPPFLSGRFEDRGSDSNQLYLHPVYRVVLVDVYLSHVDYLLVDYRSGRREVLPARNSPPRVAGTRAGSRRRNRLAANAFRVRSHLGTLQYFELTSHIVPAGVPLNSLVEGLTAEFTWAPQPAGVPVPQVESLYRIAQSKSFPKWSYELHRFR